MEQITKSKTKIDLEIPSKPDIKKIPKIIKVLATKFALKILNMSHRLVYRHIPLYRPNILKHNILAMIKAKNEKGVTLLPTSKGKINS